MLSANDLEFSYGALGVINGVDMRVKKGAIHGLIGPNGAGKTTLINLISGSLSPTKGRISYNGEDISKKSVKWRRHNGISRSFQKISIFNSLTVADQLDIAAKAVGESNIDQIVSELDLRDNLMARSDSISYGEQRRLDIALALIGNPPLVLLDEPAAGLSREESLQLADHLQNLAVSRGTTVLLVEHHLEVVYRVCSFLTVLDQGRVIAEGPPDTVRKDPRVLEAYLGRAG